MSNYSGNGNHGGNENKITPTLGPFTIPAQTYGTSPFQLTHPTSNSNGSFSYTSSNTSIATISGSTVTIKGIGSTTITATQASTSNYNSASTTATLTINKADPVINNFSDISKTYGDSAFQLNPQSNSSGTITYASSNTIVATISGNYVTLHEPGTTTITLTQSSTSNYNQAIVQITLTVNKKTPVISSFSNLSKTYGDSTFALNAQSTSPGTITYSTNDTSVATISGNTVTIVGAGTATITLSQPETTYYTSIIRTITLTVNKKTPTLGTFAVSDKTYGLDASFALTPPTSDSSGSFSYTSSNTSVATISGSIVTIHGAGGPVTITATQAATSNYASASKSDKFTVNKGTTILGAFTVSDKTYGDAPFTLTPPTSNRAGNFNYASSNTSVATIYNNIVTIRGTGTTTISATQESTSNYNSATVQDQLIVNIKIFTIPTKTYTPSPLTTFTITSPVSSSLGSLMYASSNTSVATISNNTVTIRGAGTTTITVIQYKNSGDSEDYGNNNYGRQNVIASATLSVLGITRSINNFSVQSPKTYGDAPFTLDANTTPPGETIFYSSSDTSVATISGNVVTIVGAGGPINIIATLAAHQNYIDVSATASLIVNKATPTISNFSDISKTYGDIPFTLNARSDSSGSITYSSLDGNIATIDGNTVTINRVGSTQITATVAESANYQSNTSTITLTVAQAASLNKFIIPVKQYKFQINKAALLIPRRYIFNQNSNSIWRIYPNLPEGLNFSKITGKITGIPTSRMNKTPYIIHKIENNDITYSIKFTLEIV